MFPINNLMLKMNQTIQKKKKEKKARFLSLKGTVQISLDILYLYIFLLHPFALVRLLEQLN